LVLPADLREDAEPFLAKSLKRVRTRAWLKGATTEDIGSGPLHPRCNFIEKLVILDGTWTCNEAEVPTADERCPDLDDRVGSMEFPTRQLVRLLNPQDLFHARQAAKHLFRVRDIFIANGTDDGSVLAAADVRHEPEFFHPVNDVLKLFFSRVRLKHQYHLVLISDGE
jgi:hypothetical protein